MCLGEENRELFPKVKFFICPLSYTIITFFHTDNRQPSWTRWPCWLRPGNTTVFSCQAAAASSCSCVSSASDLHLRVTSPRHCFSIRSTDKYLRKWRRPHVLVIPTPDSVSRTPPPPSCNTVDQISCTSSQHSIMCHIVWFCSVSFCNRETLTEMFFVLLLLQNRGP